MQAVALDSSVVGGGDSGGAGSGGAGSGGADSGGAGSGGAGSGGADPEGVVSGVAERPTGGGVEGSIVGGSAGSEGAGAGGTRAGGARGSCAGGSGARGYGAAGARGSGAGGTRAGGAGGTGAGGAGGTGAGDSLTECREPASRPASPVARTPCACRVCPSPDPGTYTMTLRPSSVPQRSELQCLSGVVPHFAAMLFAPEGDPDVLDIPTLRSYAKAITVPPRGASVVDGMWIFRGVDFFQTFSPTLKMTTPRMLLRVAAQRDYELHSLDFNTVFLLGSLHEEIWLRRPPGFTGSFSTSAFSSLRHNPLLYLRATRSQLHLRTSPCEAKIYAGAMAAQELRWLTYLLTDLGERPHSPVLYVDNNAIIALCREQRLEHITKHIFLRYFLVRESQQRGQLRLSYVASQANTADIFTKALGSGDHQRFCTALGLAPTLPHLLVS
ncbi:unnamed protein product [Closterium sp. NIES-53]